MGNSFSIKGRWRGNCVQIKGELLGETVTFILDSQCPTSALPFELVKKIGLLGELVDNAPFAGMVGTVGHFPVELGEYFVINPFFAVHNKISGGSCILGADILFSHECVIDMSSRQPVVTFTKMLLGKLPTLRLATPLTVNIFTVFPSNSEHRDSLPLLQLTS